MLNKWVESGKLKDDIENQNALIRKKTKSKTIK